MKTKTLISTTFALIVTCALAGCYTTEASRTLAAGLGKQVAEYGKSQDGSISKLNAEYRSAFAQLIGDLANGQVRRLKLERTGQAQAMADKILLNWKVLTTHTAVVDELFTYRERQLKQLNERAVALEGARAAYAQSYAEIQLELEKLQKVEKQINSLSIQEDQKRAAANFLINVAKIYKEVRDESAKAATP